eukprot:2562798-Prymnesium_polylepis.4
MRVACALLAKIPRVARACVRSVRKASPDQLTTPLRLRALRAMRFGASSAPRTPLPRHSTSRWAFGVTQAERWRFGVANMPAIGRRALAVSTPDTRATATVTSATMGRGASCAMERRTPGTLTSWKHAVRIAAALRLWRPS